MINAPVEETERTLQAPMRHATHWQRAALA